MHRFGRHLLAAAGVGAVLLGGSYGYGRHRVRLLLREAVAPEVEIASLRLEPDWSRLQIDGVHWADEGERRHVDRIRVESPVDVLRRGRWRFESVSLEGVRLQGFGAAERKIRQEIQRRMRRHGLMLVEEGVAAGPVDVETIVRTAVARSQGRWTARLASASMQTRRLGEAAEAVIRRDLPDANPLRGRGDADTQFAELRRLESQLAAIDGALEADLDGWQEEAQRLREECAQAVQDAFAQREAGLLHKRRERVESNLQALCDAYVESIVARFLPAMAAAAEVVRTSHVAVRRVQSVPAVRGTDFFGLGTARSIGVGRLTFAGRADDGDRAEHFSGELFPQPIGNSSGETGSAVKPCRRHGVVVLSGPPSSAHPRLRLWGDVTGGQAPGGASSSDLVRLDSHAVVGRHEAVAETPTLPNFRLTLSEADFRLTFEDDGVCSRFRVQWRSPEAAIDASGMASGGEAEGPTPVRLPDFCGTLEVDATDEGVRIDVDLGQVEALVDRFAPQTSDGKIAAAGASLPPIAGVDAAIADMLAARRVECREIRGELADLRQQISIRHSALAGRVGGSMIRTATTPQADEKRRSTIR